MKLIRAVRTLPIKQCIGFILRCWDVWLMFGFLALFLECNSIRSHRNELLIESKKGNWLDYYIHNNWTIEGKIPRYKEEYVAPITETKQEERQLVRFSKRTMKNQVYMQEKLIVSDLYFGNEESREADLEGCERKCTFSYNKSLHSAADAVIYHPSDPSLIPQRSFPQQLYVWMYLESPYSTYRNNKIDFKEYDNVFNMTMTYRRNSDVYFPYNTTLNIRDKIGIKRSPKEDLRLLLADKKKLSAWAVSNCPITKGSLIRTRIMNQLLIAGLDVEIFGKAVNRPLPGSWKDVYKYLRHFKFYFSFENSVYCRDYITEKVWSNALLVGSVPVIWGPMKKDVEAVLPEGSYILVENFTSPKALVDYLNYLNDHDDEYVKFLSWRYRNLSEKIPGRKNDGQPWMNSKTVGFCQLCHMLYDDEEHERKYGTRPRRVVESIFSWWYLEETRTCLQPTSNLELHMSSKDCEMLRKRNWLFSCDSCIYVYFAIHFLLFPLFIWKHWRDR